LQVAVGVAECRNRMAANVHLNGDRLANLIVVEIEFGQLHQPRLAVS
jgi:hypothetical protein